MSMNGSRCRSVLGRLIVEKLPSASTSAYFDNHAGTDHLPVHSQRSLRRHIVKYECLSSERAGCIVVSRLLREKSMDELARCALSSGRSLELDLDGLGCKGYLLRRDVTPCFGEGWGGRKKKTFEIITREAQSLLDVLDNLNAKRDGRCSSYMLRQDRGSFIGAIRGAGIPTHLAPSS